MEQTRQQVYSEKETFSESAELFMPVEKLNTKHTCIKDVVGLQTADVVLLRGEPSYWLKVTLPKGTVVKQTKEGIVVLNSKKKVSDFSPVPVIIRNSEYEERPELLSDDGVADVELWKLGKASYKQLYEQEKAIVENIQKSLVELINFQGNFIFSVQDSQVVARTAAMAYERVGRLIDECIHEGRTGKKVKKEIPYGLF